MMKEIEGEWKLNENSCPVYSKVIEAKGVNKDELYKRVLEYFVHNYRSGKDVIQTQDKELGLIIGRGLYDTDIKSSFLDYDCYHLISVEVKDERVRVTIILQEYAFKNTLASPPVYNAYKIYDLYPIKQKTPNHNKNLSGEAFYLSHKKALKTFDDLEKVINKGILENYDKSDDW